MEAVKASRNSFPEVSANALVVQRSRMGGFRPLDVGSNPAKSTMMDDEIPPDCYVKTPSPMSKNCLKCRWLWPCIAIYVYRRHGIFARPVD